MFHLYEGRVQHEHETDWSGFSNIWAENIGAAAAGQSEPHTLHIEVWHMDACWCWSGGNPDCPHGLDWYACPTCEPYMTPDVCSEHRAGCPVGAH